MKKNKYVTSALTALALVGGLFGSVAPAHADGFSVSADKSKYLTSAGDTVTVTLAGVPANQGVYVRLCKGTMAEVTKARPTLCFGQGAWVSTDPAQLKFGAGDATKPVALAVQAQFTSAGTAVDCTVDACGIHIRRDHNGGSGDYSLDRFIPLTFGPAPVASATAAVAAGKVSVTVANAKGTKVTFVVGNKKYVRNVTNDSYVFSVAAPKGKFVVTAGLDRKQLTKVSLSN